MAKNIVRYMTVGEPVIIGQRPKPIVEEEPEPEIPEEEPQEEIEEPETEPEPEPEPEPERGIPQEVLDKVYAEIDEIERKLKLTKINLRESQEARDQAEKLKKEAQDIRDAAQVEADKIIAETKHQAEELLEQVHQEGFDAGHEEGVEQGIKDGKERIEEELADIVRKANEQAQKTIQDAKEQTSEYFIRAEDDIVKIVMMAIEKILPQHFLDVPQVILPVVREAIFRVRDQKEIKIHVEPYSYDLILMARTEFQSMLTDGTATIEIVSDEALKPGDCVIETPNGGVDARLSTQINLLKSAVENVLNKPL